MIFNHSVLLSALLAVASAKALPGPVQTEAIDYLAGKTITDLQWFGPVEVGGPDVALTGTIEAITAKVIDLNPNYFEDGLGSNVTTRDIGLEKRGISAWPPNCNVGIGAHWYPVKDGIDYLYRIGGTCYAAPRSCARVSCSYDAGIFLCNDKYVGLNAPSSWIADYAQGIWDHCLSEIVPGPPPSYRLVRGQLFDIDGTWNVIITEQDC